MRVDGKTSIITRLVAPNSSRTAMAESGKFIFKVRKQSLCYSSVFGADLYCPLPVHSVLKHRRWLLIGLFLHVMNRQLIAHDSFWYAIVGLYVCLILVADWPVPSRDESQPVAQGSFKYALVGLRLLDAGRWLDCTFTWWIVSQSDVASFQYAIVVLRLLLDCWLNSTVEQ